jgi:hypothetical protein
MSLYKLVSDVFGTPARLSHNVPAVYDGFWFAIRKMRSILRKPKTVAEQKYKKALAPTVFLCSPSRSSGDA